MNSIQLLKFSNEFFAFFAKKKKLHLILTHHLELILVEFEHITRVTKHSKLEMYNFAFNFNHLPSWIKLEEDKKRIIILSNLVNLQSKNKKKMKYNKYYLSFLMTLKYKCKLLFIFSSVFLFLSHISSC